MFFLLAACASAPAAKSGADEDTCPTDLNPQAQAATFTAMMSGTGDECQTAWYLDFLDVHAEGAGPWHEDIFVDHTDDARTFDVTDASRQFTEAAVPDVIRGPDDVYYMYFVEGSIELAKEVASSGSDWMRTHGLLGYGAINMATSTDGVNFSKDAAFVIEGITQGMVVDPEVHALPDGTFRLYYIGTPVEDVVLPEAWQDDAPHTLYYAESDDLVHWTQVGVAAEGPNADPSVMCINETDCFLASTGLDWGHSTDGGATFDFEEMDNPAGFAPKFLRLADGAWKMFFNSAAHGGPIDVWLSRDDGETWTPDGVAIDPWTVEALSFWQDPAGGWFVYYHYWQDGYSGDSWGDADEDSGLDSGGG